ncbi:HAMP domain-containing sensor histidine kinase [Inquilinus sp. CAU 1745]|uniref:sensor histidine kinase n=1 Tax=Inquilinus sp. CAU 1745 TaxID=3140369 RepID=UPI00325B2D59
MPSTANLLRTTTFRLAVLYLGLFTISVMVILGLIYWFTAAYIDRQTNQTILAEVSGLTEQYNRGGLRALRDVVADRSDEPGSGSLYLLTAPDLTPVAGNIIGWPTDAPTPQGWIGFEIAGTSTPDGRPQPARALSLTLPGNYQLLVGRNMRDRQVFQQRIIAALAWSLVLTLGLGGLGGVLISRSMMQRVEAINRTTTKIMGGSLQERVRLHNTGDEFDQLARNLNAMLDQIEQLMTGMRQVGESIAHDLRTPLTRLRSRLELALIEEHDKEGYRATLQETIAEADQLLATFTALLSIAQAESGTLREAFEPVRLGELAETLGDLYGAVAEESGLHLEIDRYADPIVSGNRQLLSQALANLLDNAVKYTPEGGRITLSVRNGANGGGPALSVADNGPGIPPEHREEVLRRFVRLEQSRSSPGNGLGLSLVNAVARLHGASLTLDDNDPGLRIEMVFPHDRDVA